MPLASALALGLPLALAARTSAPQTDRPTVSPQAEPGSFIYYDYVEDGQLRGGRVPVDHGNPLHVSIGPERRATGSPVTTLLDNGPPANRIDLVIVGDGYTAAQQGQFAADVDAVWPTFLAEPPLSSYATYFNVHRVDVVSNESGVDNDPTQGIQRDTALDMAYWCGGTERLLCVNVSKANGEASNAPDRDTVLALANSTKYGGAGYSALGTLSGRNGSAIEIALHEFGHSFAQLADEYDYGGSTTYSGPEPSQANVTTLTEAEMIAQQRKWVHWLDLPHVGAFEGAMYSRFGIYRPTFNSKMRSLGRPFQEVDSERLIRHIYTIVRPIDDATPAGRYPLDAAFFVDPLDPVGHALDVQWYVDGVAVPGATGTTFDAAALALGPGTHGLEVVVVDNTPMVRAPAIRANRLTDRRSWILTDGRNLAAAPAPARTVGPLLTLVSGSGPRGELEFALDASTPEARGAVLPLLWIATSAEEAARGPGPLGKGAVVRHFAPLREGSPRPLTLHVVLPGAAALSARRLYAQAALLPLAGGRALRSNVIEF